MDNPYVGRIVTIIVAPVLVGVSGWFSTWAADNLPGAPKIDPSGLADIGQSAALAIGGVIVVWLYNRGKHERQQAQLDNVPPSELPR